MLFFSGAADCSAALFLLPQKPLPLTGRRSGAATSLLFTARKFDIGREGQEGLEQHQKRRIWKEICLIFLHATPLAETENGFPSGSRSESSQRPAWCEPEADGLKIAKKGLSVTRLPIGLDLF